MEIGCTNKSTQNADIRWLTTTNNHTRVNIQHNQKIRILSVTLVTESATCLGSLKKEQGHLAQQLDPVVDSVDSRHVGNRHRDVLTFLSRSFLIQPVIWSPVTIPAVLLGVQTNYDACGRIISSPTIWSWFIRPHNVWVSCFGGTTSGDRLPCNL